MQRRKARYKNEGVVDLAIGRTLMISLSITVAGAGIREPARNARSQADLQAPESPAVVIAKPETIVKDRPAAAPPSRRLSVELDTETSRYIFKSIDPDTGSVVRQYPTEQMLSLFTRVRRITGQALDKSA